MARSITERTVTATFGRPKVGLSFRPEAWEREFKLSGQPGWQSNGGPHRGHPARSLPLSLEIAVPENVGVVSKIHLIGVFALYASPQFEAPGTFGASVQLLGDSELEFRLDLLNARHYIDASDLNPVRLRPGDGTSLETVGQMELGGAEVRVDMLTIDLHEGARPTTIRFRDLGSPASFVICDVILQVFDGQGCPFKPQGGGVSLSDIAAIVRLGDRVKLIAALDQLCESLDKAEDLDEARGQALTFLSMVTAATLEMAGSRSMHRVLLQAARELDRLESTAEISRSSRRWVEHVAPTIFRESLAPSSKLVDRALELVDRNYAKDLTDASVAAQLGLSTSHFRFLFKEATGQPFHKYLVALRLEKARTMLVEQKLPVNTVAQAVGFAGLSHFSRAFTQRFQVSPTTIRKSG